MVMHELRQAYRGGIRGDNDTFGAPGFRADWLRLDCNLLHVDIDTTWFIGSFRKSISFVQSRNPILDFIWRGARN
jgi:hypothetical protein